MAEFNLEFKKKILKLWETVSKADGIICSRAVSDTPSTDESLNELEEELKWFTSNIETFSEEEKQSFFEVVTWFDLSMLSFIGLDNESNDTKALFAGQEALQKILDSIEKKYESMNQ